MLINFFYLLLALAITFLQKHTCNLGDQKVTPNYDAPYPTSLSKCQKSTIFSKFHCQILKKLFLSAVTIITIAT